MPTITLNKRVVNYKKPELRLRVSKRSPCPVCGFPSWCLVSGDGRDAICARIESDIRVGDAGWLHILNEEQRQGSLPSAIVHEAEACKASTDTCNTIYRALLGEVSLTAAHRSNLLARGMTPEQIEAGLYRSLPRAGRPALVARLTQRVHCGELPIMAGVPGFYMVSGEFPYASLSGAVGMLMPVKDALGRIVALQVRVDTSEANKYRWVSSKDKLAGCGSGSPIHIAGANFKREYVFVTEGVLKATIASARLSCPVLGVAGVGSYSGILDVLKSLGSAKEVVIAYDMDKLDNINVRHHLNELIKLLVSGGYKVFEASWAKEFKGLDDFLVGRGLYVQHLATLPILGTTFAKHGLKLVAKGAKKQAERLSSKDRVYRQHYDMLAGRGWRAWRQYLIDRRQTYSLDCLQYGHSWECPSEGHEHIFEPSLCGDWHYCVVCGFRYEQIQAEAAMDKFMAVSKALPGVELMRLVFTLPVQLQGKISWEKFGIFTKLANDTLTEYYGGQLGGELTCQWWHSKTPISDKGSWYPHLHGAVMNVVRSAEGNYTVVSAFVSELKLKTIWARRLGKQFKLKFRICAEGKNTGKPQLLLKNGWSNINLRLSGYVPLNNERYVYPRGKRKGQQAAFTNSQYLKARLRYDFRLPQADIASWADESGLNIFTKKQAFAVDFLIGVTINGERFGLPKNFKRERWFGFFADGVVKKRMAELNVIIKSASERKQVAKESAREVVCPVHHVQCSLARGRFGEYLRVSRWDLVVGDILLSANYRQDKRHWVITQAIYERWHTRKEPVEAVLDNSVVVMPELEF